MNFVLNTQKEKKQMLSFLGMNSINDLFKDINEDIKQKELLKLPKPLSELELTKQMRKISEENADMLDYACFLGGGAYNHFIPSVVDHMISRGEFYSSYTPYQAEMSQGMLQSIFEFQSMICELTEMDVANASMYDGASAMAEAAIMAAKYTERKGIIISKTVHPEYRQVLQTYANAFGLKVFEVEIENGLTDIRDIESKLNNSISCVILQSPNFFGVIENLENIEVLVHKNDCKLITCVVEPISLGILKPPGKYGADIVVGEAQAFGNPMSYGGPHLGFMATKHEFLKKIPGRLSGVTVDRDGEKGFVLTLQTREQHIRRERATSNICTNQALNALAATVYLALVGKNGLRGIAEICAQRAHYACKKVCEQEGFELRFNAPFFNEFVISCPTTPKTINQALLKKKIIGGLELGRFYEDHKNCMMFSVTEMNSIDTIEKLVDTLHEVIS